MVEWREVAKVSDMAGADPGHVVVVNGQRIAIFDVEGTYFAVGDQCTHETDGRLSEGWLEGATIECPLHQACFDVRTGKVISGLATADVPAFPVKVENGTILLKC